MDQALNSQKTPHTSPLRASYGMSFVSILMKNDRVIKGFYCIYVAYHIQVGQWWRHDREAFSMLLTLCDGNTPVTGGFPLQISSNILI